VTLILRHESGHTGVAARYMPVPVTCLQLLVEHSISITVLEVALSTITLAVGVLTATFSKESILGRKADVPSAHLRRRGGSVARHSGGIAWQICSGNVAWKRGCGNVAWNIGSGDVAWNRGSGNVAWNRGSGNVARNVVSGSIV